MINFNWLLFHTEIVVAAAVVYAVALVAFALSLEVADRRLRRVIEGRTWKS
jgi:hypothetical protein